jgi:signal transduction histidine kinase
MTRTPRRSTAYAVTLGRKAAYALIAALLLLCGACWAQGFKGLVTQDVWLDSTQLAGIEEARNAEYVTVRNFKKLALTTHVAWLRLRFTGAQASEVDAYLYLRPMLFTAVTLYQTPLTPDEKWRISEVDFDKQLDPIYLGKLRENDEVYVQLRSAGSAPVMAYVGTQQSVKNQLLKTTVVLYAAASVLLCFTMLILMSLGNGFDWAKVGVCMLLPLIGIGSISATGVFHLITDFDQKTLSQATNLLQMAVHGAFAIGFSGIAFRLLNKPYLLRAGGLCAAWYFGLMALSFINFNQAAYISTEYRWVFYGVMTTLVLVQSIQSRRLIKFISERISLALLVVLLVTFTFSTYYLDRDALIPIEFQADLEPYSKFFFRLSVPILLTLTVYFLSVRAERMRSAALKSQVAQSAAELDLETQRLNKQRQLTGMLAHELKNPLMSSQLALSSIQKRLDPQDPALQRAASIQSSLEEIDRIIERCVEADSFEHGQAPIKLATFSLDQLINQLESGQNTERLYVIQRGIDSSPLIQSDPQYVLIILKNLVSNALKYSPPDSLIELLIRPAHQNIGAGLLFSISNEVGAAGLPDPARMFERYYRGEGALSQSGAGLGLWLAQEMAGNLGTVIEAQMSEHKISFSFFLPLKPASA